MRGCENGLLVLKNLGEGVDFILRDELSIVGNNIWFSPLPSFHDEFETELKNAIERSPDIPITLVIDTSAFVSDIGQLQGSLKSILNDRVVVGQKLPEKSSIIILSHCDKDQINEVFDADFVGRLRTYDLKDQDHTKKVELARDMVREFALSLVPEVEIRKVATKDHDNNLKH